MKVVVYFGLWLALVPAWFLVNRFWPGRVWPVLYAGVLLLVYGLVKATLYVNGLDGDEDPDRIEQGIIIDPETMPFLASRKEGPEGREDKEGKG